MFVFLNLCPVDIICEVKLGLTHNEQDAIIGERQSLQSGRDPARTASSQMNLPDTVPDQRCIGSSCRRGAGLGGPGLVVAGGSHTGVVQGCVSVLLDPKMVRNVAAAPTMKLDLHSGENVLQLFCLASLRLAVLPDVWSVSLFLK